MYANTSRYEETGNGPNGNQVMANYFGNDLNNTAAVSGTGGTSGYYNPYSMGRPASNGGSGAAQTQNSFDPLGYGAPATQMHMYSPFGMSQGSQQGFNVFQSRMGPPAPGNNLGNHHLAAAAAAQQQAQAQAASNNKPYGVTGFGMDMDVYSAANVAAAQVQAQAQAAAAAAVAANSGSRNAPESIRKYDTLQDFSGLPGVTPTVQANKNIPPVPSGPLSAVRQTQLTMANISRKGSSPHHHARMAHLAARGQTDAVSVPDAAGRPSKLLTQIKRGGGPTSSASQDQANGALDENTVSGMNSSAGASSAFANNADGIVANSTSNTENSGLESSWTALDLGGMSLRSLAPSLFGYQFLTTLYLSHNLLTELPSSICELEHLTLLDLSSNRLTSLPSELGHMINLRELLLFDNQLTTLPMSFGFLYQLQTLGLEGNPLKEDLRALLDKSGTQGVITQLRDNPRFSQYDEQADRDWIMLDASSANDASSNSTFSILSYNILNEHYATQQQYGYTPSWALTWEYRRDLILQEITNYNADFVCLQEVNLQAYEEFFVPNLKNLGYSGFFFAKSRSRTMAHAEKLKVDGCATFHRVDNFRAIDHVKVEYNQAALRKDGANSHDFYNRVMTKDNVALLSVYERQTKADSGSVSHRVVVSNTHFCWNADLRDVKLIQAATLLSEVQEFASKYLHYSSAQRPKDLAPPASYTDTAHMPIVLAGDYNSTPDSGVYDLMCTGSIPKDHEDFMIHNYGNYTTHGVNHALTLKSAYASLHDLPFTNYTSTFKNTIDYIFYTQQALAPQAVLGPVDPTYLKQVVGFPNAQYPSDHICLLAEFQFK